MLPRRIATTARKLTADHPKLNVLVNNAGIMQIDDVSTAVNDGLLVSTPTTNLMGPMRLTGALIEITSARRRRLRECVQRPDGTTGVTADKVRREMTVESAIKSRVRPPAKSRKS